VVSATVAMVTAARAQSRVAMIEADVSRQVRGAADAVFTQPRGGHFPVSLYTRSWQGFTCQSVSNDEPGGALSAVLPPVLALPALSVIRPPDGRLCKYCRIRFQTPSVLDRRAYYESANRTFFSLPKAHKITPQKRTSISSQKRIV